MRGGFPARSPAQDNVQVRTRGPGARGRRRGGDGDVEEPDLAETVLWQNASPVAAGAKPDVSDRHRAETDGCVTGVPAHAGACGRIEVRWPEPSIPCR